MFDSKMMSRASVVDPSAKESLLGQALGSAVIGALLGFFSFVAIRLLGVPLEFALLAAALVSALVVSTFSRYHRLLTGSFKSPILLPTTIGTSCAGPLGILAVWFELPIRNLVVSLIVGMVAGCAASVAASLLKSRVE
jgi:hypothetical protein